MVHLPKRNQQRYKPLKAHFDSCRSSGVISLAICLLNGNHFTHFAIGFISIPKYIVCYKVSGICCPIFSHRRALASLTTAQTFKSLVDGMMLRNKRIVGLRGRKQKYCTRRKTKVCPWGERFVAKYSDVPLNFGGRTGTKTFLPGTTSNRWPQQHPPEALQGYDAHSRRPIVPLVQEVS